MLEYCSSKGRSTVPLPELFGSQRRTQVRVCWRWRGNKNGDIWKQDFPAEWRWLRLKLRDIIKDQLWCEQFSHCLSAGIALTRLQWEDNRISNWQWPLWICHHSFAFQLPLPYSISSLLGLIFDLAQLYIALLAQYKFFKLSFVLIQCTWQLITWTRIHSALWIKSKITLFCIFHNAIFLCNKKLLGT